jgi:hypothetical protein
MKPHSHLALITAIGVGLLLGGCKRKDGGIANAELDVAAGKFATAAPASAPVATPGAAPAPAPAQEMQQAVQAYKGGQFEDTVVRLQKLRATPAMSPQQQMALNDAMAAVMTDIYAMAAKGDQRAIQAVKQYEKMQTQKR